MPRPREYKEKLVIEWGTSRNFRQLAYKENKIILEIRARPKDEKFPPYIYFMRKVRDLNGIYPSWQGRLKEHKGVYLLTFDDGRVLIRDHRDARDAWVSILEVSGSAQTGPDIIKQEWLWKEKLGIKAKLLDTE